MNQRIEELAKDCFEYYEGTLDGDIVEFNYNRFAELIIKECAMIADEGFGSAHFGLGISGKMLKDHFGIKE